MLNRRDIKFNSKKIILNHMLKSFIVTFVYLSILTILKFLKQLGYIFLNNNPLHTITSLNNDIFLFFMFILTNILITIPLFMGISNWFFKSSYDIYNITFIFKFFSSYKIFFKSVLLGLNITIKFIFYSIIFYIPVIALLITLKKISNINNLTYNNLIPIVYLIIIIISIISFIFLYFFLNRYFLVLYLFYENQDLKIKEYFSISINYTKKYKAELLYKFISLIGVFMLIILIVPIFFIIPYILTINGLYAKQIISLQQN